MKTPARIALVLAGLAHLVERHLAKVEVASSSLVSRSKQREDVQSVDVFPFIWRHSQVVRHESAKLRFPSSNLGGASTMNDIPNLNCYGSIEMSFILFKSSRERLSWPFLIFYLIELK